MESLVASLSTSNQKLAERRTARTAVLSSMSVPCCHHRKQISVTLKAAHTGHLDYILYVSILCILSSVTSISTESTQSLSSSLLSSAIEVISQIKTNHSLANYDRVQKYENLIYSCLSKINTQMERCVSKFNKSFEQHTEWTYSNGDQTNEKVRRYCCMQNDFKDCWTSSIRTGCSELESRLSKWLPIQVLKDLRTDDRCRTYVLYPHKCRENSFSLWQILAFLLLVPFVAFFLILFVIVMCKRNITYKSLKRSQFDLI